jgi:Cu-Zn family superoxide dismutase
LHLLYTCGHFNINNIKDNIVNIIMVKSLQAVCVLTHTETSSIKGVIRFEEDKNGTIIRINVQGLTPGKHGIHIHQAGDLTDGCTSACSHFNPSKKTHGGPDDRNRHAGDLGNITASKNGTVKTTRRDSIIKLKGKYNIIGRMVVIHKNEDDLGKGGLDSDGNIIDKKIHNESLKTGNAGSRIACGVIGYAKEC